ncbi:hypothetical protein [Kitasatospora viridis]|uniref:hypothetical protein n=1 Tax=Kitasatospora viridis TaxID=281105 RepID=UPI0014792E14|nr:hypothetical protein [Kitasatospora viridis]
MTGSAAVTGSWVRPGGAGWRRAPVTGAGSWRRPVGPPRPVLRARVARSRGARRVLVAR